MRFGTYIVKLLNMHAQLSSEARGPYFCLDHHIHPYFVGTSSEGSGEDVQAYLPLPCLHMLKVPRSHDKMASILYLKTVYIHISWLLQMHTVYHAISLELESYELA